MTWPGTLRYCINDGPDQLINGALRRHERATMAWTHLNNDLRSPIHIPAGQGISATFTFLDNNYTGPIAVTDHEQYIDIIAEYGIQIHGTCDAQ